MSTQLEVFVRPKIMLLVFSLYQMQIFNSKTNVNATIPINLIIYYETV